MTGEEGGAGAGEGFFDFTFLGFAVVVVTVTSGSSVAAGFACCAQALRADRAKTEIDVTYANARVWLLKSRGKFDMGDYQT
jgi:hypothetical protein